MTSYERLFWVHVEIATDSGASVQDQQSTDSLPRLYVHFRAAVGCLAGRVRSVSTDVRDVADVTAWLAPLPFQGMVFSIWPGKLPCADDYS